MPRSDDIGKLVLRLTVGLLLLLHGIDKLSSGVASISAMLQQHGLPGILAYLVYIGEIVAPLFLIVGLYSRPAAGIIIVNMLFAIGLFHQGHLFSLGKHGGWGPELQGFFLFGALAVAFLGTGRFGLGASPSRLN